MCTGNGMINKIYFHKKRILVTGTILPLYGLGCYKAKDCDSEIIRMGVAGSLGLTIVECAFHLVDTVNIRTKTSTAEMSTGSMLSQIWKKEGVFGFGRGFSACLYGSMVCGFMYFVLYKYLKGVFISGFGETVDSAICFGGAAMVAETLTLSAKYPYDLIKCRL
jgi:hypothetical protein